MNRSEVRSLHPTALASYPSLGTFYNSERRRLSSRELDVGLWWREGVEGPLHRAAWIYETGELYLVRLGPTEEGGGRVELLARIDTKERLEARLAGWRERCGQPRSLTWLRARAGRGRRAAVRRPLPSSDPIAA